MRTHTARSAKGLKHPLTKSRAAAMRASRVGEPVQGKRGVAARESSREGCPLRWRFEDRSPAPRITIWAVAARHGGTDNARAREAEHRTANRAGSPSPS